MTQPTPAEQPVRHTVDSITSDALDALYADLDWARRQALAAQQEATETVTRAERAEAAIERVTSPEAIRAAAFAISDYTLTHLGRDLGTIHIEPMAEAGIRAALDEHQEQT